MFPRLLSGILSLFNVSQPLAHISMKREGLRVFITLHPNKPNSHFLTTTTYKYPLLSCLATLAFLIRSEWTCYVNMIYHTHRVS